MIETARDDEQRYALLTESIKRLNLANEVVSGDAWACVMEALAAEEKVWRDSMYTPEKLEFKAGVLTGLKIVRDYADRVAKELRFLNSQKQELTKLLKKEK